MKYREKIRLLRDHGFEFVRVANHGEIWRKEKEIIQVPRKQAKEQGPRANKNWMKQFERAILQ